MMCEYFGVSRSGFYAWSKRAPSKRQQREAGLVEQVQRIHRQSRGYYGSPRIKHALQHEGVAVSRSTVARLMRHARLQGRSARSYRRSRAGQRAFFTSVPNTARHVLVQRLDQVWVGDVTYLRVAGQWRYLAVVMDKFSRRVIGWSLSAQRDARLTCEVLAHAWRNRKPQDTLHVHSDRGIEYSAWAYRDKLSRLGMTQSMNRPGQMNDNAFMESFFHSMKCEALYGQVFHREEDLRETLLSYIQFYNQQRLHSSLGYRAPARFEDCVLHSTTVHF